jgi:nanoRNase/pAp phosphatase (c-di-AMP/oligoRNAs hydrolase)
MTSQQFRLVTRSDFDGLVCGMLLKELDLINEITFVHPKDMQDGKVPISSRDITTNLPYVEGCHLAFDHHSSEVQRNDDAPKNHVILPNAASAARVVYDYYGGRGAFRRVRDDLMSAVDKADSAQFSISEVLHPTGWTLLNFLMDSRTGLGRFRQFRISNYELMMTLIDRCRDLSIKQVHFGATNDLLPKLRLVLEVEIDPARAEALSAASAMEPLVEGAAAVVLAFSFFGLFRFPVPALFALRHSISLPLKCERGPAAAGRQCRGSGQCLGSGQCSY